MERMTGASTRLIDMYIQQLFTCPEEWIEIIDHYPKKRAHEYLFKSVLRRLEFEHRLSSRVDIKVNKKDFKIKYSPRKI